MMIRIDVNVDEIVGVIQSIQSIISCLEEKTKSISTAVDSGMDEIRNQMNRLTTLKSKASQINTKLEARKDEVNQSMQHSKQMLQHEKKEIEIVHYDEKGKKYIEKKPNPQYIKLQNDLERYEIELKEIQEKITKCESIIKQIDTFSEKLSTALGCIEMSENQIVHTKNENVDSLGSAVQKLRQYQELVEQYSEKRFII